MGTARTTLDTYIAMVRSFMRDYPHLNRLIADSESSDASIAMAIMSAVDDFNMTSPLAPYTVDSFPYARLLIIGAVKTLLESVAILQARNHLTYSDGQGVQVNESDRAPVYLNIVNKFANDWERGKREVIVKINIAQATGAGVASDFSQLESYYANRGLL